MNYPVIIRAAAPWELLRVACISSLGVGCAYFLVTDWPSNRSIWLIGTVAAFISTVKSIVTLRLQYVIVDFDHIVVQWMATHIVIDRSEVVRVEGNCPVKLRMLNGSALSLPAIRGLRPMLDEWASVVRDVDIEQRGISSKS